MCAAPPPERMPPDPSPRSHRRASPSIPDDPRALLAHALLLGGATVAVFLAGKPQQGALGVFLLFAGVALIVCPPRVAVEWRLWIVSGLLVGGSALSLLARTFADPTGLAANPRRCACDHHAGYDQRQPGLNRFLARGSHALTADGPLRPRATDPLAVPADFRARGRARGGALRRAGHLRKTDRLALPVRIRCHVRIFPQPQPHGDPPLRRHPAGAGGPWRRAARGPLGAWTAGGRGHGSVRGGIGLLFTVAGRDRVPAGRSIPVDRRTGTAQPRYAAGGLVRRRAAGRRVAFSGVRRRGARPIAGQNAAASSSRRLWTGVAADRFPEQWRQRRRDA